MQDALKTQLHCRNDSSKNKELKNKLVKKAKRIKKFAMITINKKCGKKTEANKQNIIIIQND